MQIKKILGYYWPHIKKYPWTFYLPFLFYGLATTLNHVLSPVVYKRIIDVVTTATDPVLAQPELMVALLVLALFVLSDNVLYRAGDYIVTFNQSKVLKRITDATFAQLHRHSNKFFNDTFGGSLVAKVKRFTDSYETLHDTFLYNIWMNTIVFIGIVSSLLWFAPKLAVLFFVWVLLFAAVTMFFTKRKIPKDLKHATSQSETTGVLADIITNVMNLKMFASSRREEEIFADATHRQERRRFAAWNFQNHQIMAQGLLIGGFEVVGMVVVLNMWSAGTVSAGTIVLFQAYLLKIFDVVWNIGRNAARIMQAFADAKEMIDIFETPIDVQDIAQPVKCVIKAGAIDVRSIDYSYHEEGVGEGLFKDFSLSIKSGEKVGLVGHSGSGKTTITKLLLRFMDVNKGEILIDGQNIAKIKQDDLRRKISYVPQDPILFHRSLRENIAYGKSDATQEEIIAAAKAANAHEFIANLPEGYDTLVGERGVKLSGGERQRVAIARAMLKDAPILILDEATSALDSISERHIQEAFERLMQGRTTLAIAHRLSTIQKMDRIVVFDKGVIVEQGTHSELTKNDGVYAELWQEQSSGFIE